MLLRSPFCLENRQVHKLLERSRVDAARLRDEVLWAGLLPSCMTLLDWGRLN